MCICDTDNAIVKLWCIPFQYVTSKPSVIPIVSLVQPTGELNNRDSTSVSEATNPEKYDCDNSLVQNTMKKATAMRRIAEECGMESIVQEVSYKLSPY